MKALSLNVVLPRKVLFNGQTITSGIFKDAAKGSIMLRKLDLDGDKQADLTVHGGVDRAVYSYPAEHYDYWRFLMRGLKLMATLILVLLITTDFQ
jgi:MOSC domain-containing protein YiiM